VGHWNLKHWKLGTSSDATAVHYNCLTSVQTVVRALGLTDISSANIVVSKVALELVIKQANLSFPAILIAPSKQRMPTPEGNNVQDDVYYSVLVYTISADDRDVTANLARQTLWLQRIARTFRNQRLANVATIMSCQVEQPEPVALPSWLNQYFVTSLVLTFISREPRG
jgi:hypothetical protein